MGSVLLPEGDKSFRALFLRAGAIPLLVLTVAALACGFVAGRMGHEEAEDLRKAGAPSRQIHPGDWK